MKTNPKSGAFTLVELLVVLAILALMGLLLVPAMASITRKSSRVVCADNLKQIGMAFRTWADAHNGRFPTHVPGGPPGVSGSAAFRGGPVNQGGASWVITSAQANNAGWIFFVMSNELVTPKILACPADSEKAAQTNFTWYAGFTKANLSYGFGIDIDKSLPSMIMSLDRNAGPCVAGSPPTSSSIYRNFVVLGTNAPSVSGNNVGWSEYQSHMKEGNALLCDGSVQMAPYERLAELTKKSGDVMRPVENGIVGGANRAYFPN
jgi:prepilin-type N-terminal cleavage/methylation domain-containing protein